MSINVKRGKEQNIKIRKVSVADFLEKKYTDYVWAHISNYYNSKFIES